MFQCWKSCPVNWKSSQIKPNQMRNHWSKQYKQACFFFCCLIWSQHPATGTKVQLPNLKQTELWLSLIQTETSSYGQSEVWSIDLDHGRRHLSHRLFWFVRNGEVWSGWNKAGVKVHFKNIQPLTSTTDSTAGIDSLTSQESKHHSGI